MWVYLLKRMALMVPMLLGITLVSFMVIHLAPGTPVEMQTTMNPKASLEAQKRLKELYGLDKPLQVQYWDWLKRLARLDFGRSFSPDGRPVWDKIKERIGITLGLNLLSLLIILAVAIPLGVLAAVRPHSWFDKGTTLFVFFGFAMPTFWLALLLMLLFGVYLDWLPISGLTSLNFSQFTFWQKVQDLGAHVTLPVLVAAFTGLAGMSRYMRGSMLEVIRQDYITTARAKGLPERTVIFKHALRNALLPVITLLGMSVPGPHRRQCHLRDHLRHPRHGTVVLRRGDGPGLSPGDGGAGHRGRPHPHGQHAGGRELRPGGPAHPHGIGEVRGKGQGARPCLPQPPPNQRGWFMKKREFWARLRRNRMAMTGLTLVAGALRDFHLRALSCALRPQLH